MTQNANPPTNVGTFTFFAESLCGGLEPGRESIHDELNPYESMFAYDISPAYPPPSSCSDKMATYAQGDTLSWAEDVCLDDYSPLSTPEVDVFLPYVGTRMSLGNGFTDATKHATPSPLQLNEYFNIFDFDFSTSLPNEFFPSSGPPSRQPSPPPSSCFRKSSHAHRNLCDINLMSQRPRESSPSTSDSDQKRRFPCLILGCARRFTSQYTLKVHMEAHKPKPRVSFPCTQGCSERFSRQHDRLRHEVAKHGRVCEFLCDECGRFFSSKKTLGNHKCPVAQGGTRWVVI